VLVAAPSGEIREVGQVKPGFFVSFDTTFLQPMSFKQETNGCFDTGNVDAVFEI